MTGIRFSQYFLGIWLANNVEKVKSSMPSLAIALKVRYLIILMGFFAVFGGFIYNDFASIPWNIFGTCYKTVDPKYPDEYQKEPGCVYPFGTFTTFQLLMYLGIDPRWLVAPNELIFVNSLKMKMSIIIGVTQMTLGVFLKAWNCLYFRAYSDFFFSFIPQITFLICIFGYTCLSCL